MEVTFTHCAGLDVHKKTVVACCMTPESGGRNDVQTRTFGTMTADLLVLSDWLSSKGVTHVAMEATGEFWKPVFNILEGSVEVWLVNAHQVKNVPGRKTDVKDAEWLADLLRHGLVRPSFIPPLPQRDLRDLTRQRMVLVQDRATVVNRLQKVLEWANIKLTSVVTDVTGVSARAMLEAIVQGQSDPQLLAELAKAKLRNKRAELQRALSGRVREHHRFLIANHLGHIDYLEEQIALFDEQIKQRIQEQTPPAAADKGPTSDQPDDTATPVKREMLPPLPWVQAVALLDTITGVAVASAEQLLAEFGADMSRFPSSDHMASWSKICPGNRESAGKRYSGKTGKGSRWIRPTLIQVALAAIKVKDSYTALLYQRLKGRRGHRRAIVAVAHHIVEAMYHMLRNHEPYREPDITHLNRYLKEKRIDRMCKAFAKLGYSVKLEPIPALAA
jgi:transposase